MCHVMASTPNAMLTRCTMTLLWHGHLECPIRQNLVGVPLLPYCTLQHQSNSSLLSFEICRYRTSKRLCMPLFWGACWPNSIFGLDFIDFHLQMMTRKMTMCQAARGAMTMSQRMSDVSGFLLSAGMLAFQLHMVPAFEF